MTAVGFAVAEGAVSLAAKETVPWSTAVPSPKYTTAADICTVAGGKTKGSGPAVTGTLPAPATVNAAFVTVTGPPNKFSKIRYNPASEADTSGKVALIADPGSSAPLAVTEAVNAVVPAAALRAEM